MNEESPEFRLGQLVALVSQIDKKLDDMKGDHGALAARVTALELAHASSSFLRTMGERVLIAAVGGGLTYAGISFI